MLVNVIVYNENGERICRAKLPALNPHMKILQNNPLPHKTTNKQTKNMKRKRKTNKATKMVNDVQLPILLR